MLKPWVLHKLVGVCIIVVGSVLLAMVIVELTTRWIVTHVSNAFASMASHVFRS